MEPVRVLFVCLGNICRSPMAEGICRRKLIERGLDGAYVIDSAGTASYHIGAPPDPRTMDELRRHGSVSAMTARQVQAEDFEQFDWILAMDTSNLEVLRRRRPPGGVHPMLALESIGETEVPDPYYGGRDGFRHVYVLLDAAIDAWIVRWESGRVRREN